MKSLITGILFFALSSAALTQDSAEIIQKDGVVLVRYGEAVLSPTKIIPVNESVSIYVVLSGELGTDVMITVFRGIIWDKKGNKLLGMFPYRYEAKTFIHQPEWKVESDRIYIKDDNLEIETTIDL